jgi:glycosyltransferase involved in cell wall biosynthesis
VLHYSDLAKAAAVAAPLDTRRIAVLVPCYNEEAAIASVIRDFAAALPTAAIYVFDNNSSDGTVAIARAAGAIVGIETRQGKGNVVRRMFADIDADLYVLVDGDATYEASAAPLLVEKLIAENLDMVTGVRVSSDTKAYRPGHVFGNWLLTRLVATIFGKQTQDMLSGYRVFSRRFVKSFPALSRGFEIETEFTVQALELRLPIADVETPYHARPEGSASKLNTLRDGFRILRLIASLIKEERPLQLFILLAALFATGSLVLGYPVVLEFMQTGLVPRLPTAILASALGVLSVLSFFSGLILDSVSLGRREMKRLHYLSHSSQPLWNSYTATLQ